MILLGASVVLVLGFLTFFILGYAIGIRMNSLTSAVSSDWLCACSHASNVHNKKGKGSCDYFHSSISRGCGCQRFTVKPKTIAEILKEGTQL